MNVSIVFKAPAEEQKINVVQKQHLLRQFSDIFTHSGSVVQW